MHELSCPPIVLISPPTWALDGSAVVVVDAAGVRTRWRPWVGPVLEELARGAGFEALRACAVGATGEDPRRADLSLRHFLFSLFRAGNIDVPLPPAPRILRGRYERLEELGRGGVGVADLCRDLETGARVVAKRAWDFYGPMDRVEARLREEGAIGRRLDHPGVARVLDEFDEGGAAWIVREFVDGPNLEDLAAGAPLPAPLRRAAARDVAAILAHIHERGFLLMSVRPSNFHVAEERARLVDAGHCRPLVEGVVEVGRRQGSPGFTPPELAAHRRASVRSDIWGYSRLYAFLATGALPRQGESIQDLTRRVEEAGAASAEVELVRATGAHEPAERLSSMAHVLARLVGS